MRLFRPGIIAKLLYPEAIFRLETSRSMLCLTFDDGPDPESTPALLDILDRYGIKAMFFCCGSKAEANYGIMSRIISDGHLIGNHGFSHLDGWKTPDKEYIDDVNRAAPSTSEIFFRPPFGRLSRQQYLILKEKYRIIFWDLMPFDFDFSFGGEKTLAILKKRIRPGSIIVLHDMNNLFLKECFSEFLDFAFSDGYRFILPE